MVFVSEMRVFSYYVQSSGVAEIWLVSCNLILAYLQHMSGGYCQYRRKI